jgi:hypothetical protein
MSKEIILNRARIEEFWQKFLTENKHSNSVSFFGGTNLRSDNTWTKEKIYLSKENVKKAHDLCNGSDVLIYNFYFITLSILLMKYEDDFCFLSSVNTFEQHKERTGFFILQPSIQEEQSFKNSFSSHKGALLKSIEYAFDLVFFEDSFLNV